MSVGGGNDIQIQVQWMQDPGAVPVPVNQYMLQAGPGTMGNAEPDTFILTFGHVTPPVVPQFNDASEAAAFAANSVAFVVPVARLSFTPARLRELHSVIEQFLRQGEEA
jgi:hypothetical protein